MSLRPIVSITCKAVVELLCQKCSYVFFLDTSHPPSIATFHLQLAILFTHNKHGSKSFSPSLERSVRTAAALPVFALSKDGDNASCSRFSPLIKMVFMAQVP